MGRKPSIEDRIVKKLGRMFLGTLSILGCIVVGFFATFLLFLGPLLGIIYFVKKGRLKDLSTGENREQFGHITTAIVGGIAVGYISKLVLGNLEKWPYIGPFASHSLMMGVIIGVSFFIVKGLVIPKKRLNKPNGPLSDMAPQLFVKAFLSLIRGVLVGTILAMAFVGPLRGMSFIVADLSGSETLIGIFEDMSFIGISDAMLGVIGIVVAIPAGFAAWNQALRLRTQISNIPTSKIHSAAIGLAEFKGVVREIVNEDERKTEIFVNSEKHDTLPENLKGEEVENAILFERYTKKAEAGSYYTEVRSRFFLEDDTGQILVDPRSVVFWNGEVQFFFPSARSIYLKKRYEERTKDDMFIETRKLYPGDTIYLIGSVEELENTNLTVTGPERLVLRPSSVFKSTNLLHRIFLGYEKQTRRTDIFDVFFLTDVKEQNAGKVLTKGIGMIWVWVAIIIALCVPLVVT